MAPPPKNPELTAVQQIINALQPLDAAAQDRVLSSVLALLGKSVQREEQRRDRTEPETHREERSTRDDSSSRPKGLTELLGEKQPGTNAQRIALFAYYRDKHENNARFSRNDLESYFNRARLDPPGNYDRDFNAAVDKGWIHEHEDQSYITTSGIEIVEQGFEGERGYARGNQKAKKKAGARKGGKGKAGRRTAGKRATRG